MADKQLLANFLAAVHGMHAWAAKFLDTWCTRAMRSRIEPVKKFARTVRAHRELLLNYFRAKKQFSSGGIEGLNNKAKVTMRRAYGYRTFRVEELSLYHGLDKLPEPKLAHRFFGRSGKWKTLQPRSPRFPNNVKTSNRMKRNTAR